MHGKSAVCSRQQIAGGGQAVSSLQAIEKIRLFCYNQDLNKPREIMNKTVFTIGHSVHTREAFLELLLKNGINCIVDVRSIPNSAHVPQFNKDEFSAYLKSKGIVYMSFADEFGARHEERELLDNEGVVDFKKIWRTGKFLSGVERLKAGVDKGYKVALMCSEAEPMDCHRFSMISRYLVNNGFEVKHVLRDGAVIDNSELESKLLKKYEKRLPVPTLFEEPFKTPAERIDYAYSLRNSDVGYRASI